MFVPTKAFLTKGVGRHREKLTSFEMALRDAHLANFNLVRVSSIFPPHCELVDREEGLSLMQPGQVVFAVIAESSTNEPSRLVAASIGVAMPADLSLSLRLAAHPELRRISHRAVARRGRGAARHGAGARAVVRGRLLPHLHRPWRHGIGTRRAAAALPGVDRTHRRGRGRLVRFVPARDSATGVPDAGAAARAGP